MQHTNQVGLLRENLHTTSSIIDTAVGTPLCWWLTRCHRVLPSQVSYGLIGWVGAGVKYRYSKPFVCICKHTATRMRVWRGCPAGRRLTHGECSWPSALHLSPCPYSLQSLQLSQDWSANDVKRSPAASPSSLALKLLYKQRVIRADRPFSWLGCPFKGRQRAES